MGRYYLVERGKGPAALGEKLQAGDWIIAGSVIHLPVLAGRCASRSTTSAASS